MSAATATADMIPNLPDAHRRPSLGRLTKVELRKMLDTRAGFWLQLAIAAVTIIIVVIVGIVGNAEEHRFMEMLWVASSPAGTLLPVVGILLVSSEWSQRTAIVTFTLVPQRMRVMVGKLGAAIVVALAAFVACIVVALIATAVVSADTTGVWSMPIDLLGQTVLKLIVLMIMGVAFGALFLSSAPAIVLSFVLPLVWGALGSIPALHGTAEWLDISRAAVPLTDHALSGTEWAQFGTSLGLWVVLPLAIGLWRVQHSGLQ